MLRTGGKGQSHRDLEAGDLRRRQDEKPHARGDTPAFAEGQPSGIDLVVVCAALQHATSVGIVGCQRCAAVRRQEREASCEDQRTADSFNGDGAAVSTHAAEHSPETTHRPHLSKRALPEPLDPEAEKGLRVEV